MPALTNARQEAFARGLAEGKSQAKAFAEAGYKPSEPHASRLASSGKVAARISEIRAAATQKLGMTLAQHLEDLRSLREEARKNGQYSAAISAEIARGKASGVHVEKSEQIVSTKRLPASVDEFV